MPLDGFALVGDLLSKDAASLDPENGSTVWKNPKETIGGTGFRLGVVVNGRTYL